MTISRSNPIGLAGIALNPLAIKPIIAGRLLLGKLV
jgi:hypothetical protein